MSILRLALLLIACACQGSAQAPTLVIRNARMLDTHTATVRSNMTIVISGDRITAVTPDASAPRASRVRTINARGRLVTPAFIDVHHHVGSVFPDSITPGGGEISHFVLRSDSIAAYRARWAREYLPYGVAVVREVGGDDTHLPLYQAWMRPSPDAPDFFPSGGALATHEPGRVPYRGHSIVKDPAEARRRVREYHAAGIRDIKLYWRLREPELVAALDEARKLGMHVTAHVGFGNVSVRRALALGVPHLEHAFTLGMDVVDQRLSDSAWARTRRELGPRAPAAFMWGALEHFNQLGDAHPGLARLVRDLAAARVTVTPTIHLFAEHVGVAYFKSPTLSVFHASEAWTEAQRTRARAGYERLEELVLALHRAGVQLAVGTDSRDPGKAVLSEILLLHLVGIPMAEALALASLGGARVIERESDYGSIAPGRKAHLIVFDEDPIAEPRAILGGKLVIKDGIELRGRNKQPRHVIE